MSFTGLAVTTLLFTCLNRRGRKSTGAGSNQRISFEYVHTRSYVTNATNTNAADIKLTTVNELIHFKIQLRQLTRS